MRLPATYIPTRTSKLLQSPLPVRYPPVGPRLVRAVTEVYNKNSQNPQAQILDAEFVEIHPPGTKVFKRELNELSSTLKAEELAGSPQLSWEPITRAIGKYRQNANNPPEYSGTHLDIIA